MYNINFISLGRLLPRNLILAGFTILPCVSKQEEDYDFVFSSTDIKKNIRVLKELIHGLCIWKV